MSRTSFEPGSRSSVISRPSSVSSAAWPGTARPRVSRGDRRDDAQAARVRHQAQQRRVADSLARRERRLDEVVGERQRRDLGPVAPGEVLPRPGGAAAVADESALVPDQAPLDAPHPRRDERLRHRLERGRRAARREARREVGVAAAHEEHVAQDAAEAVLAAGRLERRAQARVGAEGVERRRRRDELQRRSRAEGLPGIERVERAPGREAPHLDPPERRLEPGPRDDRLDRLLEPARRRIGRLTPPARRASRHGQIN